MHGNDNLTHYMPERGYYVDVAHNLWRAYETAGQSTMVKFEAQQSSRIRAQ